MSRPFKNLRLAAAAPSPAVGTQVCTVTGVTIPECSCRRCVDELIRHHSPAIWQRRLAKPGEGDRHAA